MRVQCQRGERGEKDRVHEGRGGLDSATFKFFKISCLTVKYFVDDEKILQNLERQYKLPYFLLKALRKHREYHMKALIVLTRSTVVSQS